MSEFYLVEETKANEKLLKENVILQWKLFMLEKKMLKLRTIYKWRIKASKPQHKQIEEETQTQKQGFCNLFLNELNSSMENLGEMVDTFINKNL